jgi:hypothetical protein
VDQVLKKTALLGCAAAVLLQEHSRAGQGGAWAVICSAGSMQGWRVERAAAADVSQQLSPRLTVCRRHWHTA